MDLPDKIIWHKDKERPKTEWLLRGFEMLGIPIERSNKWINAFSPPRNPRGPIVYPIEFVMGEKRILVMYDINTVPENNCVRLMGKNRIYAKVHVKRKDVKRYGILPVPNSGSRVDDYLGILPTLRAHANDMRFLYDFFFLGWHDDDGLRMETVKRIRKMEISSLTGLMPFKHHTKVPKDLEGKRLPYGDHLANQCLSKLNLALPGGRHLPFVSFRHVELWGMGCCVISKYPDCVMVGDPDPSRIMVIYDLDNLEEVVEFFVNNDQAREEIATNGMTYYEKWLKPESQARYWIEKIQERLMK